MEARPMSFNDASEPQWGPLIPWDGGERPVSGDTLVRCHFRNRRPYVGAAHGGFPEKWQAAMWKHAPSVGRMNPNTDIIAYQVLNGQ